MNPYFSRTLRYIYPYWPLILVSAFCSTIVGGLDGAFAFLVEPVLKKIFSGGDRTIFLFIPLGIIFLFILRGVARYLYDTTIRVAGQKGVQDIRNDLYSTTINHDMTFFNRTATGEIMSRLTNDIGIMQEGVANLVCGLFRI